MKRTPTDDARRELASAKKEVSRVKAMTTVVVNALGESDESQRLETCMGRILESWNELTRSLEKSRRFCEQLSLRSESLSDRSVAQTTQQYSRNFKAVQTLLREQLKYEQPQFFADSLVMDVQRPEDVLKRIQDDESNLRKMKTLSSYEYRLTEEGHAEISLRWSLGFSAELLFTGVRTARVVLDASRTGSNLSAFLRIFYSEIERRLLLSQNLPMELCNWVERYLTQMFTTPCKNCGRLLSFSTGVPLLAMVRDLKEDFFHEECIRETVEDRQ